MSNRKLFESREQLEKALTEAISEQLTAGIAARGSATLVVSGGSTPKALFQSLSRAEINWKKVTVLLADERWVDINHADSNSAMVKAILLQHEAAGASWIDYGAGSENEEEALQLTKRALLEIDTFDVVILGMGGDSHTASLFPCSDELLDGLTTTEPALMVQPTTAPHRRLSLSKSRLLKTEMGVIHLVGREKRLRFEAATVSADNDLHPISHFAHRDKFDLWFAP